MSTHFPYLELENALGSGDLAFTWFVDLAGLHPTTTILPTVATSRLCTGFCHPLFSVSLLNQPRAVKNTVHFFRPSTANALHVHVAVIMHHQEYKRPHNIITVVALPVSNLALLSYKIIIDRDCIRDLTTVQRSWDD